MSELIDASHVFLGCTASTVDEVLLLVAQKAVLLGVASDVDELFEALKARELQGTTGLVGGFAIPHARCAAVREPSLIVLSFDEGIEWHSMDDVPVNCAIALLAPLEQPSSEHLALLSKLAVMLMSEDLRKDINANPSPEYIAEVIGKGMEASR